MLPILREYGAIAAREIVATGVDVRIWDLGNEVDFGMAGVVPKPFPNACNDSEGSNWYQPPDGIDTEIGKKSVLDLLRLPEVQRIEWLQTHVWNNTSRMFASVAAGVRSVQPGARFSTHLSGVSAVQPTVAIAFYSAMQEGGFLPDELGFSFYPSSSEMPPGRLEAFQATVVQVHKKFQRPVFIAEFGYPTGPVKEGPFATWTHAIKNYPVTPQGQADLLRALVAWGPSAGASGIRVWAPDLPFPAWEPFSLFSLDGKTATAKLGLSAFAERK